MALNTKVTKKKDYVYVVELKGTLDSDTCQALESELEEILSGGNAKALVLDMAGLTYICSMGLKIVIETRKAMEAKKASFLITNMQPQIKKVFDMVKILPMFDIFDDMPEADKYIDAIIKEEISKKNK